MAISARTQNLLNHFKEERFVKQRSFEEMAEAYGVSLPTAYAVGRMYAEENGLLYESQILYIEHSKHSSPTHTKPLQNPVPQESVDEENLLTKVARLAKDCQMMKLMIETANDDKGEDL